MACPVNTRWSSAEIAFSLRDCGVRCLIADADGSAGRRVGAAGEVDPDGGHHAGDANQNRRRVGPSAHEALGLAVERHRQLDVAHARHHSMAGMAFQYDLRFGTSEFGVLGFWLVGGVRFLSPLVLLPYLHTVNRDRWSE